MPGKIQIEGPYTTTERDALVTRGQLPQYFLIFNSTTAQFEFWTGSAWQTVPSNQPVFTDVDVNGNLECLQFYLPSIGLPQVSMIQNDRAAFTMPVRIDSRFVQKQGADVASANDLTLGDDGNTFEITGTTQINAISLSGTILSWDNGSVITLLFTSTPTVKHNTAGGGGTVPILLAGGVDFVAAAGDRLTLVLSEIGGVRTWREVSRVRAAQNTHTTSASGRATAQTAAVASVATFTVGAADASFLISTNVLVTASTLHSFSVQVDYTDESNTARTLTLPVVQLAGTFVVAITNGTGAGPYEGTPLQIRCKAATTITIKTTGTFTTVTYNVEGHITQI